MDDFAWVLFMSTNLDTMTFAPSQQVNAKNLIASSAYRALMTDKGIANSTQELFRNTSAITSQVSLRTVRSVLAMATNPLFIELRNDDYSEFVTIDKRPSRVVVNHYKRHSNHVIGTETFYSVSEAILHCASHGFKQHCNFFSEFSQTQHRISRLNKRASLLIVRSLPNN